MRLTVAVAFTGAVFAASAFAGHSRALAQNTPTVWSGVYTPEQAQRGEGLYAQGCARCHGFDLLGGEMAPALADGQFRSNWEGVPVG